MGWGYAAAGELERAGAVRVCDSAADLAALLGVETRCGAAAERRGARFLTLRSLRWVVRHRAYTPWYLVRYWRFLRLRLRVRDPQLVLRGFVFLDRGATVR